MPALLTLLLCLGLALPLVVEAHAETQVSVALERAYASPVGSSQAAFEIYASELLTVLERKGNQVRVRADWRGDDRPRQGWLDKKFLAAPALFSPLSKWEGEQKMELYTSSGDSGQTYHFERDGTFRASHESVALPAKKWSGRLYKHGQIIWARPKSSATVFDTWSVFVLIPNGSLCSLNFDDPGTSSKCKNQ